MYKREKENKADISGKWCMKKMRISPKRQNKKESDSGAEEYNNWIRKKLTTTGNLIREKTDLGELLILSIITSEVFLILSSQR